jgi:hypothetical protein
MNLVFYIYVLIYLGNPREVALKNWDMCKRPGLLSKVPGQYKLSPGLCVKDQVH